MEGASIRVLRYLAPGPHSMETPSLPSLPTLASSRLVVSTQGMILPPKGHCQCLEILLVVTTCGEGVEPHG